jgi:predicted Fe-Mo cluster-binding NifX family protein
MKIAIPLCRNRIAPLFEVAESFFVFRPEFPDEGETLHAASGIGVAAKCRWLADTGVSVLLCGALADEWQRRLQDVGVEVHAFLAAEVHEVLQAFRHDGPAGLVRFAMPGRVACVRGECGRRQRRHRRRFCNFDSVDQEQGNAKL